MDEEIENKNNSNSIEIIKWILIVIGIIAIILSILYLFRKLVLGPSYKKKNRIDEKVVIITGCNTGIGKQTALELAKRGGKIYMACRNYEKCEKARQEIIQLTGNKNVFNRTLDLASLDSVRKFVEGFLKEETRLDILINNAGVALPKRQYTNDGFEMTFGVNHLGHFLLTNLLLDTLKSSAPSRIVVLTSLLLYIGRIKKDDLMHEKNYFGLLAYSDSKLANALFTTTLARKLKGTGVTVNCIHPGVVRTDFARNICSPFINRLLQASFYYFLKTPKAGAQTSIRLAIDPDLENISGKFFMDCYLRLPLIPRARNEQLGEWLWNKSAELTGLISDQQTNIQTVVQIENVKNENSENNESIEKK